MLSAAATNRNASAPRAFPLPGFILHSRADVSVSRLKPQPQPTRGPSPQPQGLFSGSQRHRAPQQHHGLGRARRGRAEPSTARCRSAAGGSHSCNFSRTAQKSAFPPLTQGTGGSPRCSATSRPRPAPNSRFPPASPRHSRSFQAVLVTTAAAISRRPPGSAPGSGLDPRRVLARPLPRHHPQLRRLPSSFSSPPIPAGRPVEADGPAAVGSQGSDAPTFPRLPPLARRLATGPWQPAPHRQPRARPATARLPPIRAALALRRPSQSAVPLCPAEPPRRAVAGVLSGARPMGDEGWQVAMGTTERLTIRSAASSRSFSGPANKEGRT